MFSSDETLGSNSTYIGIGTTSSTFVDVSIPLPVDGTINSMTARITPDQGLENLHIELYVNCLPSGLILNYIGASDPTWTEAPNCPGTFCKSVTGNVVLQNCDLIATHIESDTGRTDGAGVSYLFHTVETL
jgi:hypothetical protein